MVQLSSFSAPPEEGVVLEQPNTCANVDGEDLKEGTLYITESRVAWLSNEGRGFKLDYPSVSLHAVSTDVNAFPQECLYLMIDGRLGDEEMDGNASDESEGNDEKYSEVRFIPDDKRLLQGMFDAMSSCQALHPDPEDQDSDDNDYYEGEEGEEELTPQGQVTLARLEAMLDNSGGGDGTVHVGNRAVNGAAEDVPMETGQFDDAEPGQ